MAGLLDLPTELIWEIIIYSHSSALYEANRHLHNVHLHAPNTVRASYLLTKWHSVYAYGFDIPRLRVSERDGVTFMMSLGPERESPFVSLEEGTKNGRARKTILDSCLAHRICSHRVLAILNDHLMSDQRYEKIRQSMSRQGEEYQRYFPVHHIPKRLFADLEKASTTFPLGEDVGDDVDVTALLSCLSPALGPPPTLATPDLVLLLRVLLLHHGGGHLLVASSDEGYSLTKAVFARDEGLTRLLIGFDGRAASAKDGMPIKVATRANWLRGCKTLLDVPASRRERRKFEDVCSKMLCVMLKRDIHDQPDEESDEAPLPPPMDLCRVHEGKRERRCLLNSDLLHVAVRNGAHEVAKWLMEDEEVPLDMKTIHFLERKEGQEAAAKGSGGGEAVKRQKRR